MSLAGLQQKHFRAIMIDMPTKFYAGTKGRPQHYGRMSEAQLRRLPIDELAHPEGCWAFVWTTSPRLHLVFDIVKCWGFRYSARGFVWIKTNGTGLHMGQGYTTRKNAEDCLLFRTGSPVRISKKVHEVIISPVREHSRKPVEAFERVEQFCPGPYLELFSREGRAGWTSWGDEVGKFKVAA